MHVPFKIHYRNNLIDKKNSYLIPRPPSWDDRNYSYGHQLYPSEHLYLWHLISKESTILIFRVGAIFFPVPDIFFKQNKIIFYLHEKKRYLFSFKLCQNFSLKNEGSYYLLILFFCIFQVNWFFFQ